MLAIITVVAIVGISIFGNNAQYMPYKEFYQELENGNIKTALIEDNKVIFSKGIEGEEYYTENPHYDGFEEKLLLNGIKVQKDSTVEFINMTFDILFYIVFFGMIIIVAHKILEINQKTFKVVKHTNVRFDDIAGLDALKTDIRKIIDVLKNNKKYSEIGIRQIKGIILEGNPGNGKTLFAKAIAEELNVNFIATKGADFQSAMMSMGARKIKILFKKAKRNKPCIIFIDEFDSIGERRNYAGTGIDKENNRIITAMLNEMDGFESQDGILVIAATNAYNSLDSALIRPGRFDLKYTITNPDQNTRVKLIELYTKKKKLADEINKEKLAESFENLSCSSIETILNEAGMEAITANRDKIYREDIIIASKKTNCRIDLKKI